MKYTNLVFEDDFNGADLDPQVWAKEVGMLRKGEPQYFTNRRENCFVENGCLVIRTLRENYEGAEYTSASVITGPRKAWLYGRIEMRAKLPRSRALWPAFWTLGVNFSDGVDWPLCGEIDIMEMTGGAGVRDRETLSTVHWESYEKRGHDQYGGREKSYVNDRPLCEDFHIYAVEWDAEGMTFFFDEHELYRMEITPDMQGAFNKPHFIILNTSLENWGPDSCPNEETELPQDYIIDYVRVYQ